MSTSDRGSGLDPDGMPEPAAGTAEGTDIAIVGMSGRFPGSPDVDALWTMVRDGRSGISHFSDDELSRAGVPAEALADPGYVKAAPVIEGIADFDAGFFGVGAAEAQILDPQQRLFLEHSWHALEDAGCDPTRFDGSVGVFGGSAYSSYLQHNLQPAGVEARMGHLAVGLANDKDSLATRVAHTLGLTGPAYGVQSYCSTSLVAVCAASSSLANFECDLALAGGVAVTVPHRVGYRYQTGGITPPDGECRAFDASGLGAPLGSGVAVVALTRLEDALERGDHVYAVIRGWAVNNDGGRKVGFTAPGVRGQVAVIAEALSSAGLDAADIDYVEAHGTGTALGDAAEIAALHQVFGGEHTLVGSIKTNVGHLDRAAGATGLIKTALALTHEQIPPTRNFDTPNPQLAAGAADLEIVTNLRAWPRREGAPRRAGVSAFGIGGTNAHVVLEEAPSVRASAEPGTADLLVWSARTPAAADAQTESLAAHLRTSSDSLTDIAHTLQRGRRAFEYRRALVAATRADAVAGLDGGRVLAADDTATGREVAFLIAGTGEQYPGMARDLYRSEPVFHDALDTCRDTFTRLLGQDPLVEALGERSPADPLAAMLGRGAPATEAQETLTLQPAAFSIGYALARLMMSWGLTPSIVAGYSAGEYVAACLAGVLELDDALALVARRASLIDALPAGSMAAVPLPAAALRARAADWDVDIAAVNGPAMTVLAGAPEAMQHACAGLADDGVPTRPLATTHAFHSRMLDALRAPLTEWIAANITLHAPSVPTVSNVTGALLTDAQATDPGYWAEHMCSPVQFDTVLGTVLAAGEHAVVELGPGRSLGAMACGHRDCPPSRFAHVVATLPAAADPRPADVVAADALARLWLAGVDVDWAGFRASRAGHIVGLPAYPFQRERYWIDAQTPAATVPAAAAAAAPTGSGATSAMSAKEHVQVLRPVWTPQPAQPAEHRVRRCLLVGGPVELRAELTALLGRDGVDTVEVADVAGGRDALGADAATSIVLDLRLVRDRSPDPIGALLAVAEVVERWATSGAAIVLATEGGQQVGPGDRPDPAHAAAAILPVVATQEYAGAPCRTVDLDPAARPAEHAVALRDELTSQTTEPLVAYRDGARHERSFAPTAVDAVPAAPVHIRAGGTYLVTGGLGEVGRVVAAHLARAGAGRIVLVGRSADAADPALAPLRALGAQVSAVRADITDPGEVRRLFAGLERLDGVVHAAAQTGPETFRTLRNLDAAAIAAHLDAKVHGAELLAEAVAGRPLDFCLVFSSTSSVLGGLAFGSYAAANAALTAIAQREDSAAGTRWIAAAWDTWAVTLDKLDDSRGVGAAMRAHAMSVEQGLHAVDAMLADPSPSLVVAAGGLADRLPGATPPPAPAPATTRFTRPDLPQPYAAPVSGVERDLAELWSEVLGIEPVGTRDNFFDLGGNSLLALQVLSLVKERLDVAVATVDLFEAPTVHALAALVQRQRGSTPVVAPATPVHAVRTDSDDRRIAVVGMAGRFPGAGDVTAFWRNLCGGVESIKFFSRDELLAAGVDAATIDDPSYVPARPVLDDVRGFDAGFFGMSPRMAALTDPQQRLFLEVSWEALEHSGYASSRFRERVGVYGGTNLSTYLLQLPASATTGGDVSTYEIIMGNEKDALTTNVSYLFDLQGPSVAVQTFCSTSLVATHLAVQSLRNGECELALAGGVSIRVPTEVGHLYGPGGQESPDGHVRTFDAQARGSMFGDGAAVVVLKRLEDAIRDGDHIWSVIRGTAMNNDGALKVGYTAPSVVGQAQVVADALADAGVTGADIGYVEAHGTATELGDPIEVAALTRAFGPTPERQYCPIGSVKTNVGHLDRAAGATGLIKTSMALHDGVLPPTLHYTSPNPEIDFENSPFFVSSELTAWPATEGRTRTAGVNSLGMGGTNVHVVVEEAPAREAAVLTGDVSARRHHVLPVSARTELAVEQSVERLRDHLAATPDALVADVAYTLQVGRKTFEHRRVGVADTLTGAVDALTAPMLQRVDATQDAPVTFLFTGVGEQYPGVVEDLYRREPVFRRHLEDCLQHLDDGGRLRDLLTGDREQPLGLAALLGRGDGSGGPRSDELARTELVQPALFALDYALARTLMTWGLQPRAMLGYSLGEYVAACLSGVLTLPDAMRLVEHRARLIAGIGTGAMLAVGLPAERLRESFDLDGVDIAALNGPSVTVVAGAAEAVDRLAARLRAAEVACRPLRTTGAFHSRMLAPLRDELTAWITANVTLGVPEVPYVSNVTGDWVDATLVGDPAYWARHMCETVQFAAGIDTLLDEPGAVVIEIGPGQSLGALVRSSGLPADRLPTITATLPAGDDPRPGDAVLTECLARLWLAGVEIDWAAYHGRGADAPDATPGQRRPGRIPLPTYPFQREPYWIEGTRIAAALPAGDVPVTLDSISELAKLPADEWLYLPVWQQTARPAAEAREDEWLVFTREGPADELVTQLRTSTSARIRCVRPGDAYSADADGYTIRPGQVDDVMSLLRALRADGTTLHRVLHLWTLGATSDADVVPFGLHTLVALARAAGEFGMAEWSLDVVVTGTAHVLRDDVRNPLAATLTGPCRVIPLEYPQVSARLVDLEVDPSRRSVAAALAEVAAAHTDALVAIRDGRRWLPDFDTMPVVDGETVPLRRGGVYLITGGLGGIALGLAERMVRDYDAKLVLLSRRAEPSRAPWPTSLDGHAEIVVGDVTSACDVRRACDVARTRFGGLHGILHAAGLPGAGLMQFKRSEELDAVIAPKIGGALAIAEALRLGEADEVQLDFLAFFSSITSATGGGPGQVDYCAANAFLDSFACSLAAGGRTVVSLGWGEWQWNAWEDGLAGYDDELQQFFRDNRTRIGIGFDEGWAALQRALAAGEPRVVICSQDFRTMVRYSSRFTIAAVASGELTGGTERHPRPDLMTAFTEPVGTDEQAVAAMWREALRLDRVGTQDNFFELGGNSLLGVSIVAELRRAHPDSDLPPHVLYEAPTVAALAARLNPTAPSTGGVGSDDSQVRAQLRRSGVKTAAARRRAGAAR